MLHRTEFVAA